MNIHELKEMERIKDIFAEYIKKSNYCELIKSEKLGFILLSGIVDGYTDTPPIFVKNAQELCGRLIEYIAEDVLFENNHICSVCESTPEEREEIKKRLSPYIEALPEYDYLFTRLWTEKNSPIWEQDEC